MGLINAEERAVRRWSVYLVRCSDGSLYTGISTDVPSRIRAHNAGKGAAYTRCRRPVALVWIEEGLDESVARKREYAIKQLNRRTKLDLIRSPLE